MAKKKTNGKSGGVSAASGYKSIKDWKALPPNALFTLREWAACLHNCRPIKRGLKGIRKESDPKWQRPPTDLLRLNLDDDGGGVDSGWLEKEDPNCDNKVQLCEAENDVSLFDFEWRRGDSIYTISLKNKGDTRIVCIDHQSNGTLSILCNHYTNSSGKSNIEPIPVMPRKHHGSSSSLSFFSLAKKESGGDGCDAPLSATLTSKLSIPFTCTRSFAWHPDGKVFYVISVEGHIYCYRRCNDPSPATISSAPSKACRFKARKLAFQDATAATWHGNLLVIGNAWGWIGVVDSDCRLLFGRKVHDTESSPITSIATATIKHGSNSHSDDLSPFEIHVGTMSAHTSPTTLSLADQSPPILTLPTQLACPLVHVHQQSGALLVADTESTIRIINSSKPDNVKSGGPCATMACGVISANASRYHNIIVVGGWCGCVHLQWPVTVEGAGASGGDDAGNHKIRMGIEKCILDVCDCCSGANGSSDSGDGSKEASALAYKPTMPVYRKETRLVDGDRACSSTQWSMDPSMPGLLMVGYGECVHLLATDHLSLVDGE